MGFSVPNGSSETSGLVKQGPSGLWLDGNGEVSGFDAVSGIEQEAITSHAGKQLGELWGQSPVEIVGMEDAQLRAHGLALGGKEVQEHHEEHEGACAVKRDFGDLIVKSSSALEGGADASATGHGVSLAREENEEHERKRHDRSEDQKEVVGHASGHKSEKFTLSEGRSLSGCALRGCWTGRFPLGGGLF